jgi:hypothetical protein
LYGKDRTCAETALDMDLTAENVQVFFHDIKTQPNTDPRHRWIGVFTPAKPLEDGGHLLFGNARAGVGNLYFQRFDGAQIAR